MSEQPVVSIVMPVYNRAQMVRESIDSALAEAADVPLEVIAVDDASRDDSFAVLQSYGDNVRAVRLERNGGQSAARNRGLELARGAYVKFLDSDDLLVRGHLAREVRTIRDEAAEIAVSGWIEADDGTQRTFEAPRFTEVIDDVLRGIGGPTSAALYRRRDDWRWDPDFRKLDDWDFFAQSALGTSHIATVPGAAYVMRHHGGERATNATMLAHALEHHRVLEKIEQRLEREGQLTPTRRSRLAQYFYKELRVLCLHDRAAFDAAVRHILELDPHFTPRDEERQPLMRALAKAIGFRRAALLVTAVKKTIRRG